MAKQLKVFHSEETRKEVLDAYFVGGMSGGQIAKAMNLPTSTVGNWITEEKKVKGIPLSPFGRTVKPRPEQKQEQQVVTHPVIQQVEQPKIKLEQFIDMLEFLINDYRKLKQEREQYKRAVEEWKVTAGKLNDQLNRYR